MVHNQYVGAPVLKGRAAVAQLSIAAGEPWDEYAPDIALVAALCAGDATAVGQLFDRYERHIHNVLFHILGADPEVLDILHDVFVTAIETIKTLKNPIALKAWLSGIAVFKTRAFIRRRRLSRLLGGRLFSEGLQPSVSAGPDISAALKAAYKALDCLPANERIAFVLRTVQGLSLEEVADACGVSLATAKRRIAAGTTKFRKLAEGYPILRDWMYENKGEA
jgi:RNA polymerase sigma-70 factor, ECF subfamily